MALAGCSNAERRLEQANDQLHAGKPREALRGYQEVLAELGEGRLARGDDELRLKALKHAADVSYLELGDFHSALSYYRRIISLYPGGEVAREARARIGDIHADRLKDPTGAIAHYADVAASDSPQAATYQLKVAKIYLQLANYQQVRTESRILREKWPASPLAEDAQLLTAQAWALEKRQDEARGAFQALLDSKPRPEIRAWALDGLGHLYAQAGKLDKAIELYQEALPNHPNPEALRTDLDAVLKRREAAKTVQPGDREAVFDHDQKGGH
jgi:tetratricopeptide (TPR) repeat protein